jgi:hypothetical protein
MHGDAISSPLQPVSFHVCLEPSRREVSRGLALRHDRIERCPQVGETFGRLCSSLRLEVPNERSTRCTASLPRVPLHEKRMDILGLSARIILAGALQPGRR